MHVPFSFRGLAMWGLHRVEGEALTSVDTLTCGWDRRWPPIAGCFYLHAAPAHTSRVSLGESPNLSEP